LLRKRTKFFIIAVLLPLFGSPIFAQTKAANAKGPMPWLKLTSQQIAKILNWVPYTTSGNICRGYYKELPILVPANATAQETHFHANRLVLRQDQPSQAHGNIIVTQPGRQLTGDRLVSYPNKKTNKPEKFNIYGNVHLREPGTLAVGSEANINIQKKSAILHNATFRYQVNSKARENVYNKQHRLKAIYVKGKNFRGTAKQIQQVKPKLIVFNNAELTTCDPYSYVWLLKTSKLRLDQASGIGTARNARLLIHGVPIFYAPYFRFPIDNRRRSGFLYPNTGVSSTSGFFFSWPYYWNIAPNYDMTITPNYYSKRGVQLSSLFRYLNKHGNGEVYFSALPNDRAFAAFRNSALQPGAYPGRQAEKNNLESDSNNRYQFAWLDNTQYNPYLSSQVNFNYVSDDYYFLDFNNGAAFLLGNNDVFSDLFATTQLTQNASLNLALQHWSVNASVENFQTLHPITLPQTYDQYARLPEIDVNGSYPHSFLGLTYSLNTEFTDFQHPLFEGDYPTTLASVTGMRYNVAPTISAYFGKAWGYIKPQVTLDGTAYRLTNPVASLRQNNSIERFVPIYDIDSGLYFDRQIHLINNNYTQTLEPRLFYLNVPFVDQNNLPNFDALLNPSFTFNQLFETNRFEGLDRIGDANQLSLGVTSRLIKDSSGLDILDFSIGEIYYFRDRKVQINKTNPPPPLIPSDTANISPIVGQLAWQFRRYWHATGNFAYDEVNHNLQNANLGINYNADNNHILRASYSFVREFTSSSSTSNPQNEERLQQINLGLSWPLSTRWQALSGINYSINGNYAPTYLAGVQYNSCCWALRVLTTRRFIGVAPDNVTRQFDQVVYLQFLLKGLTSIGTSTEGSGSPDDILAYVIPGYQDNFGKNPLFSSG